MARKQVTKVRGVYERDPGSGIWWICYKDGGVRHREKIGTRGNAIAMYQVRKNEIRAGKKFPSNMRSSGMTFSELAKEALAWSEEMHPKDLRNVKSRMAVLVTVFGSDVAETLSPQKIDQWLTSNTQWSAATKNRYRALLSMVYRQGKRHGKVTSNPARLVAPRKENNGRLRYLENEEEKALRKVLKHQVHVYTFDVAVNTGMRQTEQFTLEWGQIDMERRQIRLDHTKNGSTRVIPINTPCLEALKALRPKECKKTDKVFRSAKGEAVKRPRAWWEPALEEAKIEDFHWHDLRHTFCSRLAMAGVDIRTIAALAGHKTLQMAMRYAHLAPAHNLAAIEKLIPVM